LVERANALAGTVLARHNDAGHPLNVLTCLVDQGLTRADGLEPAYRALMDGMRDGAFTVTIAIPAAFGGSGQPEQTWISCDLPVCAWVAIRLNGSRIEAAHRLALEKTLALREANGWRCKGAPEIGRFRGPGRKDDECPLVNLLVLRLLSLTGADEYQEEKRLAIDTLLRLWSERRGRRPYLFAMGTDFRKLKYPMIWYDILHLASVLSRFPQARQTPQYAEILACLEASAGAAGPVPQSVYQFWKGQDFGQKKLPSATIAQELAAIRQRSAGT
jgi:hypothetical protein